MQVFSLPVLPVQLFALGVLVVVVLWRCCGGGHQAEEAPCPVGIRDSDRKIASSSFSSVRRKECKSLRSLG